MVIAENAYEMLCGSSRYFAASSSGYGDTPTMPIEFSIAAYRLGSHWSQCRWAISPSRFIVSSRRILKSRQHALDGRLHSCRFLLPQVSPLAGPAPRRPRGFPPGQRILEQVLVSDPPVLTEKRLTGLFQGTVVTPAHPAHLASRPSILMFFAGI